MSQTKIRRSTSENFVPSGAKGDLRATSCPLKAWDDAGVVYGAMGADGGARTRAVHITCLLGRSRPNRGVLLYLTGLTSARLDLDFDTSRPAKGRTSCPKL